MRTIGVVMMMMRSRLLSQRHSLSPNLRLRSLDVMMVMRRMMIKMVMMVILKMVMVIRMKMMLVMRVLRMRMPESQRQSLSPNLKLR